MLRVDQPTVLLDVSAYRARHAQLDEYPNHDVTVETDVTGQIDEICETTLEDTIESSVSAAVAEAQDVPADGGIPDEWGEPADFGFIVRPYSWTRGRTQPVQDLAVETLVSTSDKGRDLTTICSAEHAAITELCTDVRSVAEVAALLRLPLGVARVLLSDMIDTGLVHVHRNPLGLGSAPDFSLMERVLAGLYRL
ncbi:MAG: DUF742 domain-containing protein [Actinomycetota bacterium]|nr:DUF742 domain-containing protein [Actinomycetota bacterium]